MNESPLQSPADSISQTRTWSPVLVSTRTEDRNVPYVPGPARPGDLGPLSLGAEHLREAFSAPLEEWMGGDRVDVDDVYAGRFEHYVVERSPGTRRPVNSASTCSGCKPPNLGLIFAANLSQRLRLVAQADRHSGVSPGANPFFESGRYKADVQAQGSLPAARVARPLDTSEIGTCGAAFALWSRREWLMFRARGTFRLNDRFHTLIR